MEEVAKRSRKLCRPLGMPDGTGTQGMGCGAGPGRPALARGKLLAADRWEGRLTTGDWPLLGRSSPTSTSPRRISMEK